MGIIIIFIRSLTPQNYIEAFVTRLSELICVYINIVLSLYFLQKNFINFFLSQGWLDGMPSQMRDLSEHLFFFSIIIWLESFFIVECEYEFSSHPISYLLLWLTYRLFFTPGWIVTLNNLYHELTCTIWLVVSLYIDLFIIAQELLVILSQMFFCSRMRLVKLWWFHRFRIKT